jgi:hypothetical protein
MVTGTDAAAAAHDLVDVGVAGHAGDGSKVQAGVAGGEQQGARVVHPGVDVEYHGYGHRCGSGRAVGHPRERSPDSSDALIDALIDASGQAADGSSPARRAVVSGEGDGTGSA